MKAFFARVFVLTVGFVLLLVLIDWVITSGLGKDRLGRVRESRIDADILIIGSSRAYRHFDTDYLSGVTGKQVFNLGYDASGMETQIALLNYYLKHNPFPEILVWEINYNFFLQDRTVYKYDDLVPLVSDKTISHFLKEKELITNADIYIPYYRYRKFRSLVAKGLSNHLIKDVNIKDYKIQDTPWDKKDFEDKYLNSDYRISKNISEAYLNSFLDVIQFLRESNVKITLVFTPIYAGMAQKDDDKEEIIAYYDSLFSVLGLPFQDYTQSSISHDTLNFYNALHMNRTGVNKFMPIFAEDLKKLIN